MTIKIRLFHNILEPSYIEFERDEVKVLEGSKKIRVGVVRKGNKNLTSMVAVTTVDLSDSIGCEERFATSGIDFKRTEAILDFQMGEVGTISEKV